MLESKLDIQIVRAQTSDTENLVKLAEKTFLESHGHSASEEDVRHYISAKLNAEIFKAELTNSDNLFYLLYLKEELIGYSKIILNKPFESFERDDHSKMERLYLLEKSHGTGLAQILFDFNVDLTKKANQKSIWIYTWVENHRAIRFYKKNGFQIVDKADFKISSTHSNPNHIMQKRL